MDVLESTRLFLKRGQVHVGMTIALAREGENEPDSDELLMRILLGGVPQRVKFYPVDVGDGDPVSGGVEKFTPDVRFMPIYVFSPEEAPVDTKFVVFVDGERLNFPKPNENSTVYLHKHQNGRFTSKSPHNNRSPFPLPEGAILVPITKIGQATE